MQHSAIHPSFNLQPSSVPSLPSASGEQNLVLAHGDKCHFPVCPTGQCGRSSSCPAPRSSSSAQVPCTNVPLTSSHQPVTQPGLLPGELTCHSSQLLIQPLAHLQGFAFAVSLAWQQPCPCCFTNSHAGLLPSKEIPREATFPLHYSPPTDTRCPPSPAGTEQQMCGRPHCTIC